MAHSWNRIVAPVLAIISMGLGASSVSAVVVDDFEAHPVGTYPAGWFHSQGPDDPGRPLVQDNPAIALSGKYLEQHLTAANANELNSILLPVALTQDGDYVQYAMRLSGAGTQQTWTAGWVGSGSSSPDNGQARLGIVGNNSNNAGQHVIQSFAPAHGLGEGILQLDTWYWMRTTVRDTNNNSAIDAFDVDVFDTNMTSLIHVDDVPFNNPGATSLNLFSLSHWSDTTTGLDSFYDQITVVPIPEPTGVIALAMGTLLLGCFKRRQR